MSTLIKMTVFVCALKIMFSYLEMESADKQGEAVDPTYFRNVLMAHTGRFKKVSTQPTFHYDETSRS